jgi:hypothetical protein
MPSHVLYQIPYATWLVRLVMGGVGSLLALAIFGWWHRTPVSLTWGEIAHVYCRLGRDARVTTISLVATDGRRIEFGNTGGVDFESMHELFANQLGPSVVRRCSTPSSG